VRRKYDYRKDRRGGGGGIWGLDVGSAGPGQIDKDYGNAVRCFKDSGSETTTLNYRWQLDGTCSSDESDYTSTSRDPYEN
jgi:hypothetical protein